MDNSSEPDETAIAIGLELLGDDLALIRDELALIRRSAFPIRPTPTEGEPGWPTAPGTLAQGFLGGRWNRRDGNVYAPATIAGDESAQSQIRLDRTRQQLQRNGAGPAD